MYTCLFVIIYFLIRYDTSMLRIANCYIVVCVAASAGSGRRTTPKRTRGGRG